MDTRTRALWTRSGSAAASAPTSSASCRKPGPNHVISRRRFIGLSAGTVAAAALGEGFWREPHAIGVTRHDVPVPGLPAGLDGLRLACVSDVHLDGGVSRIARAVAA